MAKTETLNEKIVEAFKKLPDTSDQKRTLENLKILMEARIDQENKAMQEEIERKNKLKDS